jgi:type I restriction enzyme R subunit
MPDLSEKNFEDIIEAALLAAGPDALSDGPQPVTHDGFVSGGYRKRRAADYDAGLCLDPEMVIAFIQATQPHEWQRLTTLHKEGAREHLLKRLSSEIARKGTLKVLREGIKDNGCRFKLAYFRPSHGMNEAQQTLHAANIFSVVRQLTYSEKNQNSLDLVLFLNGLPLFTAELKNPFTGQTVQHAMAQYRRDRDPREPLFQFRRCLAHFAVDPDEVAMTTRLSGTSTRFLPFNQGHNGGKGNPPSGLGFATAYLWERIWARDSVLNLVEQFIQEIEERDKHGRKTGERRLIFPRYHQLESVRWLLNDARRQGPGQRYLIQHSAGSGKTHSISWLAHQLTTLYNQQDERIFDTVIVVSDRRVLDRQLQDNISQFEQVDGVVQKIDKHSGQLRQSLEAGKQIIVTTLQKFPEVAKHTTELPGQHFAIIIDEAHSSQSGEQTRQLHAVLAVDDLDAAESAEADAAEETLEDRIADEMRTRGKQPHITTFAFTATPKTKTLELFGWQDEQGRYLPHSLYSMRQAIEEGFILDVLENYTTYNAYWRLLKTVADDPRYDRSKASALLKSFVETHPQIIDQKVESMVEHFVANGYGRIKGRAKAMIVTRSRLHAVRYKQAVDRYLHKQGYPFKALVAFSGTVQDEHKEHTEAGMNGFSETQTAERFEEDTYRFLIVANKYQTGFDQPLLHTMYVDKKLGGVGAVQTLSRLNRTHPDKTETMVLDFANTADEIQAAFEPYYERTILSEGTDPNLLYEYQDRLEAVRLYSSAEVDTVVQIYYTANQKRVADKLQHAFAPVINRYHGVTEAEQRDFKGWLRDYVRLYAFLSQVLPFVDTDLEKLYVFSRLLLTRLTGQADELPVEVKRQIDIESYRLQQTSSGKIKLPRGGEELQPIGSKGGSETRAEDVETLSTIIQHLNEQYGANLSEEAGASLQRVEEKLKTSPALEATFRINPPEKARLTFDQVFDANLQELVETNIKLYKQLNKDPELAQALRDRLYERYMHVFQGVDG